MAEGQTTHIELLDGMETEIVQDPSGLTFYFLIDNNEKSPDGEPVMVEITASEYQHFNSVV